MNRKWINNKQLAFTKAHYLFILTNRWIHQRHISFNSKTNLWMLFKVVKHTSNIVFLHTIYKSLSHHAGKGIWNGWLYTRNLGDCRRNDQPTGTNGISSFSMNSSKKLPLRGKRRQETRSALNDCIQLLQVYSNCYLVSILFLRACVFIFVVN